MCLRSLTASLASKHQKPAVANGLSRVMASVTSLSHVPGLVSVRANHLPMGSYLSSVPHRIGSQDDSCPECEKEAICIFLALVGCCMLFVLHAAGFRSAAISGCNPALNLMVQTAVFAMVG